MASTTATKIDKQEIYNYLSSPRFRTTDLHTHLHGMGNADFWVKEIMCGLLKNRGESDSQIQYFGPPEVGKEARDAFWEPFIDESHDPITFANYRTKAPLKLDYRLFLTSCLRKAQCAKALHLPLSDSLIGAVLSGRVNPETMRDGFTYDVFFDLTSLRRALGVQEDHSEDVMKFQITTMLRLHGREDSDFKEYIFFDARKQQFDYAWGITNTALCARMGYQGNAPLTDEEKSNRAQIQNCFSMLNLDGSRPSEADFRVRYCGHFTPEFYPRRFALKDCILSQELTVSTRLIRHVLQNYKKNHVVHVEFSLGHDLLCPWVYKYLVDEAVCTEINEFRLCHKPNEIIQEKTPSSWNQDECKSFLTENENAAQLIPQLFEEWTAGVINPFEKNLWNFCKQKKHGDNNDKTTIKKIKQMKVLLEELEGIAELELPSYTFLFGIQRGLVKIPIDGELKRPSSQQAQEFLLDKPLYATSLALAEEIYEDYLPYPETIAKCLEQSRSGTDKDDHRALHRRLVGLDYVGDEAGFPYCPFILDSFLGFAHRENLAFRLHCGENVHKGNKPGDSITEAFWAHMDISVFTIRRIIERGILLRIGHGVAFECAYTFIDKAWLEGDRFPEKDIDTTREANPYHNIIRKTVIEVNLTSNLFLLYNLSELRKAEHQIAAHTVKNFDDKWILSTDDDGVWDIGNCAWHQHSSVSGEYCGAVEHDLITKIYALKHKQKLSLEALFPFESKPPKDEPTSIKLEDFWTCRPVLPRQQLIIALAFFNCFEKEPAVLQDTITQKLLGLPTFFHYCGIYDQVFREAKFAGLCFNAINKLEPFEILRQFLSSIGDEFAIPKPVQELEFELSKFFLGLLMPVTLTTEFSNWLEKHKPTLQKIPVPEIKPELLLDTFIGLARTLFMALDTCIRIIWNNTMKTLLSPVESIQNDPFMLKESLPKKRRTKVISHVKKISREIVKYIQRLRNYAEKQKHIFSSNDYSEWQKWINNHVQQFNELGRSEIEYRVPGRQPLTIIWGDTAKDTTSNTSLRIPKFQNTDSEWQKFAAPVDLTRNPTLKSPADLTRNPNIRLQKISKRAPSNQNEPDVYMIVQIGDAYIRPLPSYYFTKEWITDEKSYGLFQEADKIPSEWFRDALQIYLFLKETTRLRIYGLACRGASVALLAGYMLATWEKREVDVVLFGGISFGSASFHQKIRTQISLLNLNIVRMISANYREDTSDLLRDLETKTIDLTPFGAPIVIPSHLAHAQHYIDLFLQYAKIDAYSLDKGESFQIDVKDNNDLVKALSLYETCIVNIPRTSKTEEIEARIQSYALCAPKPDVSYAPLEAKYPTAHQKVPHSLICVSWKEVFQEKHIQATIRSVLDLLCGMRLLSPNVLVKLHEHHVMAIPQPEFPSKNDIHKYLQCIVKEAKHVEPILENTCWFDENTRIDVDKYVLVLIDFAWVNSEEEAKKEMAKIKHQMMPLPWNTTGRENLSNYLMLAALLRHAMTEVKNQYLSEIGKRIENCVLPNSSDQPEADPTPVFTKICEQLRDFVDQVNAPLPTKSLVELQNAFGWLALASGALYGMFQLWREHKPNKWVDHNYNYAIERYDELRTNPYPELRDACEATYHLERNLFSTSTVGPGDVTKLRTKLAELRKSLGSQTTLPSSEQQDMLDHFKRLLKEALTKKPEEARKIEDEIQVIPARH